MRTKHFNWFILMFTEHTIIKILVGRLVRKKRIFIVKEPFQK